MNLFLYRSFRCYDLPSRIILCWVAVLGCLQWMFLKLIGTEFAENSGPKTTGFSYPRASGGSRHDGHLALVFYCLNIGVVVSAPLSRSIAAIIISSDHLLSTQIRQPSSPSDSL
ncbi:hypothetical protein L1887_08528 [Cichorium endivia]|nr:hypothetical protein L1887_08528 [Cichorium endivia]